MVNVSCNKSELGNYWGSLKQMLASKLVEAVRVELSFWIEALDHWTQRLAYLPLYSAAAEQGWCSVVATMTALHYLSNSLLLVKKDLNLKKITTFKVQIFYFIYISFVNIVNKQMRQCCELSNAKPCHLVYQWTPHQAFIPYIIQAPPDHLVLIILLNIIMM